ncbi:conserved hypothetical protein [Rhodospirillum rubrum ATCC 11170]|uniref:Cytoskeleton protein RodZ-like C-terminal domain-containing protein n=4 Tax=Rhodospirillum rubrum TaxID=1085 RepID=Q2RWE5_RHORT|nr:helix-turn-helix domain-containing protein [Rhodospirillum rubrum]ABC21550.1 conserved hypothetical protein [Rhodospirillum rubrum ATCC 11170]
MKTSVPDTSRAERAGGSGQVGALLRATRLRVGEPIARVAESLRIRQGYLQAIEEGRYQDLPGAAYAVGFVRAYADHLGLHAEEVVRRFKDETQSMAPAATLEFPAPAGEGGVPAGALVAVALILAACAYGAWYWVSSAEKPVAELIPDIPDRLAALVGRSPGLPPGPSPAGEPLPVAPPQAGPSGENAPADPAMAGSPVETLMPGPDDEPRGATDPTSGLPLVSAFPVAPVTPIDQGATAEAKPDAAAPEPQAEASSQPEPEVLVSHTPESPSGAPLPPPPRGNAVDEEPAPPPVVAAPPKTPAEPAVTVVQRPEPARPAQPTPEPAKPAQPTPEPAKPAQPTPEPARPAPSTPPSPPAAPAPSAAPSPQPAPPPAAGPAVSPPAPIAEAVAPPPPPPAEEATQAPRQESVVGQPASGEVARQAQTSRIVLKAASDSWIQLRRDGALVVRRLLRQGEVYAVSQPEGLTLNVLNAGALEVYVDGVRAPSLGPVGGVRNDIRLDANRLKSGR